MAETLSVALPDGRLVEARLRRSARATVPRIRLGAEAPLHIVVPTDMPLDQARTALESKAPWIAAKIEGIEDLRASADPLGLDRPGVVWLDGQALAVRMVPGARIARVVDGELRVPDQGDGEEVAAAIGRWYRRTARAELRRLVDEEARRLGIVYETIAVRDQRTRWGSCSPAGTLSFSWRLVMMPREIARYVVVHELLHVRTPNHSKAFWRSLACAKPGWEEQASWLRRNGDQFRRWRPIFERPAAVSGGSETPRPSGPVPIVETWRNVPSSASTSTTTQT